MKNPNMDYDELFPGRFLKSGEMRGSAKNLTISDLDLEELGDGRDAKQKVVISFAETKKQWVANKTNCECIKGMFGRRLADWLGKRVTLHPVQVDAFGTKQLAIRVKGSPDIPQDMRITVKVGRTENTVTMRKTPGRASSGKQASPTEPEPPHDTETGEIFDGPQEPPPVDEP